MVDLRILDYFRQNGRLTTPEEELLARYPQLAQRPPASDNFEVVNNSATARGYAPPVEPPENLGSSPDEPLPPPALPPAPKPAPLPVPDPARPALAKGGPKASAVAEALSTQALAPEVASARAPVLNPDEFGEAARKKLYDSLRSKRTGGAILAGLAGLSGVKDATKTALDRLESGEKGAKEEFEKGRVRQREDIEFGEKQTELRQNRDPRSPVSRAKQELVAKYTKKDPSQYANVSGEQLDKILPVVEKGYGVDVNAELRRTLAGQKTGQPGEGLSEAEKAVDKGFAKDYHEFSQKGFADVKKQLTQLKEVRDQLKKTGNATGWFVGNLPEGVRSVFFQKAVAMREAVEEVVQRNLKLILGGQFTEREGEKLVARAYNPRLPEAENIKRVDRLIGQIEDAAKAKIEAGEYFERHGTLKGWTGRKGMSADEILADLDAATGSSSKAAPAKRAPAGRVAVSNGQETLYIDPDDITEAARDGYRPIEEGEEEI
jgi:hypothetical protein